MQQFILILERDLEILRERANRVTFCYPYGSIEHPFWARIKSDISDI